MQNCKMYVCVSSQFVKVLQKEQGNYHTHKLEKKWITMS